MQTSSKWAEYLAFMQWFQNTHPDLYARSWTDITVPDDGHVVSIHMDATDAKTYKAVMAAINEFYQNDPKSMAHV